MRLFKVDFKQSEFSKILVDEQVFFVQLSHLLNELIILQKCVVLSANLMKWEH